MAQRGSLACPSAPHLQRSGLAFDPGSPAPTRAGHSRASVLGRWPFPRILGLRGRQRWRGSLECSGIAVLPSLESRRRLPGPGGPACGAWRPSCPTPTPPEPACPHRARPGSPAPRLPGSSPGTLCLPALVEGTALLSPACNCCHLFPSVVFVDVFSL